MKTPRLILDNLKQLEEHGYLVGEDTTEDGTQFVYVMRPDESEEAFTLTWAYQTKAEVVPANVTIY